MDIQQIIKDNLPDLPEGVTIPDKVFKLIEKEIKAEQGKLFVSKDQYNKKVSELEDFRTANKELEEKNNDLDAYKAKFDALQDEYNSYKTSSDEAYNKLKTSSEKSYNELQASIETERLTNTKKSILNKQLKNEGANPKLVDLLEGKFDLNTLELDGENIKDWDNAIKPIKESYPDLFGTVEQKGFDPAKNNDGNNGDIDPFLQGFNHD